jgi:ribosomal protein S12 methylthiotransferase accessory factor YcaO
MIVLTVIVDETDNKLTAEGIVTALESATKREEAYMNGLLEVVEGYCMNRGKEGSLFLRRPIPETNETGDE